MSYAVKLTHDMTITGWRSLRDDGVPTGEPLCYLDSNHAPWCASVGWADLVLPCWVSLSAIAVTIGGGAAAAAVEALAAVHGRNFVWIPSWNSVHDPLPSTDAAEAATVSPPLFPPGGETPLTINGHAYGGTEHFITAMRSLGTPDEATARAAMGVTAEAAKTAGGAIPSPGDTLPPPAPTEALVVERAPLVASVAPLVPSGGCLGAGRAFAVSAFWDAAAKERRMTEALRAKVRQGAVETYWRCAVDNRGGGAVMQLARLRD